MHESRTPVGIMEHHHKMVLETGADHARRHIFLSGDIDVTTSHEFAVAMSIMDSVPGDITVNLTSFGGSIEDGFAIYDRIKLAKNRVVVVGYGPVMSMGSIILQAGDLRLLAPSARFLIHDGSIGAGMTTIKFIELGKEMQATLDRMIAVFVERTGMKADAVKKLMDMETYMSPAEAQKMGFCDGVVTAMKSFDESTPEARARLKVKRKPRKLKKKARRQ